QRPDREAGICVCRRRGGPFREGQDGLSHHPLGPTLESEGLQPDGQGQGWLAPLCRADDRREESCLRDDAPSPVLRARDDEQRGLRSRVRGGEARARRRGGPRVPGGSAEGGRRDVLLRGHVPRAGGKGEVRSRARALASAAAAAILAAPLLCTQALSRQEIEGAKRYEKGPEPAYAVLDKASIGRAIRVRSARSYAVFGYNTPALVVELPKASNS